jgi:hypothetical protein
MAVVYDDKSSHLIMHAYRLIGNAENIGSNERCASRQGDLAAALEDTPEGPMSGLSRRVLAEKTNCKIRHPPGTLSSANTAAPDCRARCAADGIAVIIPDRQSLAYLGERSEQRLVEQFVVPASVEALNEGVVLRLPMIGSSANRLGFMSIPSQVTDSIDFWRNPRGSGHEASRLFVDPPADELRQSRCFATL